MILLIFCEQYWLTTNQFYQIWLTAPPPDRTVCDSSAPRVFTLAWNIIKPLLRERTRQKVQIFGTDAAVYQAAILQDVDADQLPAFYGGTLTDPNGDPRCLTMVSRFRYYLIIITGGMSFHFEQKSSFWAWDQDCDWEKEFAHVRTKEMIIWKKTVRGECSWTMVIRSLAMKGNVRKRWLAQWQLAPYQTWSMKL